MGGKSEDFSLLLGHPTFHRKKNPKTSHLSWSEYAVGGGDLPDLSLHMILLDAFLEDAFAEAYDRLSAKSTIIFGGIHGSWSFCPNDVADVVEKKIRDHQCKWLLQRISLQHNK